MPKNTKRVTDSDNPEWTRDKVAGGLRFHELPEDLRRVLSARKRGPQKAPTKELVSIRLSPDVLSALRATGRGWQTLVDNTLRDQFMKQRQG